MRQRRLRAKSLGMPIYPARRVKAQGRPSDSDRFSSAIYLQSQAKTRWGAIAIVTAMTSLTTTKPSQVRMMGGHILPSSSGRPRLTMARRQRSASTIFSRDLPTNVDRDPSNISTHWSHSPLDQGSRVAAGSSAEGRLPSPAPSGGSSGDILLTLIEVTFRPHSPHCCSFTAVIRDGRGGRGVSFGQLARLIKSIGHIGKIDDFTNKLRGSKIRSS
jgi:hypothetical protein